MIGLFLLQAGLGAIGPQALPPRGCAAFLWSRGDEPRLVAMVGAEPGTLRLRLDGKPLVLARVGTEGAVLRGIAAMSRYAVGGVSATLTLSATDRPDLTDGALVGDATLTVDQAGQDTVVAPVGGLIGCAPDTGGRGK